jgi:hypothetical protein
MEKIKMLVWERHMSISGGDLLFWYEGLSPIERYVFNKVID